MSLTVRDKVWYTEGIVLTGVLCVFEMIRSAVVLFFSREPLGTRMRWVMGRVLC